jgi:SagB-type dehydrogenase family enzyme
MTLASEGVRLRRAKTVFAYWSEKKLIFENYRTRVAIAAAPVTAEVLDLLEGWCSPSRLYGWLPEYTCSSIDRALRGLIKAGILVREGSREALEDERLASTWSSWLPHAGIFHFATKDVGYVTSAAQITLFLRGYLKDSPQPPFFKHSYETWLQLTKPASDNNEFLNTLLSRRTHREFSSERLPLETLSKLLFYTWGVTGYLRPSLLGKLPLKTSPAAGARHAIEVYVLALRVKGLSRGLYHYAPNRHRLELISLSHATRQATEYCAGQDWVQNAAALFIMTAVWERSMWKYRFSRAYRTVLLDAGHLCQTFCLMGTHLQLAPFCTAALKDSAIEKDLGIDGLSESVLYLAGVGVPKATEDRRRSSSLRFASRKISNSGSAWDQQVRNISK